MNKLDSSVFLKVKSIDNGEDVKCINTNDELYLPLSFIKKKLDIFFTKKNNDYFFDYSDAIYRDFNQYDITGEYLNFRYINVERWDNFFDINSIPINNFRWGSHYYPISILHYGLSHYSRKVIAYIRQDFKKNWIQYLGTREIMHKKRGSLFKGMDNAYILGIDSSLKYININFSSLRTYHYKIYLDIETDQGVKEIIFSSDLKNDLLVSESKYCMSTSGMLSNEYGNALLFRDLVSDVSKIFKAKYKKLISIKIRGNLLLHDLYMSNSNRDEIITAVATWLVNNQDSKGGWPSFFDHMFYKGRTEVMQSGWYSAMAQGLALSFLVRVYNLTGNNIYLRTAKKALEIFDVTVEEGGVLNFYNQLPIYEEYPTKPGSHVLNGFIFSLFGLYDFGNYFDDDKSNSLFYKGINTLENILPLYDMGNRSAYDLTHITCKTYPNIARWAYHNTHVLQLKALSLINGSKVIKEFYERWRLYQKGYRVKTN